MNGTMVRSVALLALALAAAVPNASVAAPLPERPAIGKIVRFEQALLYLPPAAAERKVPLLLLFPGTGGSADPMVRALRPAAQAAGFALLGMSPRGENFDTVDRFFDDREARRPNAMATWPEPVFGRDATRIFRTLDALTAAAPIDPARVGILGFSHGASYALTLGLSAPDRFRSIAAISPGILLLPKAADGGQFVFLAHGRSDAVQPYRRTACSFVPKLEGLGYAVRFVQFKGGHEVDGAILREALAHFLAPGDGRDPSLKNSQPETRGC